MSQQWMNWVGIILRGITLFYSATFVIRYSRRNWKALPEGRHLMGFSVVIMLFMILSFINNLAAYLDKIPPSVRPDGNYPGRDLISLVLFSGITWFMYRQNKLLLPDDGHENPEHPQVQKDKDDLAGAARDDEVDTKES